MANNLEKRLNYFYGQFLQEKDFQDEQAYHVDRQRGHNKTLHLSGIAEGLVVSSSTNNPKQISISPGTAIDNEGRQIVLTEKRLEEIKSDHAGKNVFVVIEFKEVGTDVADEGTKKLTRIHELPKIEILTEEGGGTKITLAKLAINNSGHIIKADDSVRQYSGLRLPRPHNDSFSLRTVANGRVGLSGNLQVTGLLVHGTTEQGAYKLKVEGGDTHLGGELTVEGETRLDSTLRIGREGQGDSGLTVHGPTRLNHTLTVADGKESTLGGDLTVKGTTRLDSTLTVADGKESTLGGDLTVKGATTLNTLTVGGAVVIGTDVLNGKLEVKGKLYVNGHELPSQKLATFDNDGILTIDREGNSYLMGRLGIGIQHPRGKLQIINTNEDANGHTLVLGPTNASNLRLGYNEKYSWIQSHDSKPLAINPVGYNVGIGVENPKAKLHIESKEEPLLLISVKNPLNNIVKKILYVDEKGNLYI